MADAARLLRTVVHLHPAQIWHRAHLTWRRRRWERDSARVDARYRKRAEALAPARFDHPGLARVAQWRQDHRERDAALAAARDALEGRFRFLNRTLDLGRDVAWYRPDLDVGTRLWKTLLHEFSYAEDLARADRETGDPVYRSRLFALVASWRAASPIGRPGFALDAWNARAVATRLVHWSLAAALLELPGDAPEAQRLGREVGLHGLFLRDNLERDLRGNHLMRDAAGLVFAEELTGGVPDALALLERQVAEQVLADGGHVERAPMYHAICLRDLLEVQLLLGERAPGWLSEAVRRMAGFLEGVLLGDGDLPLFGDGWLGEVAPAPLLAAARAHVGEPVASDGAASGLVTLARGPARAVLRAGAHGPDYLLGHAHADLLSFELSVGEQRVVADTGTSLYDPGPERQYVRSTAAHNTVQLDGEELLEAWGSFRAGRRGRARLLGRGESGGWHWVQACHDAWRFLPGRPLHRRLLAVGEKGALVIDAVTGSGRHRVESRLHLHPDRPADVLKCLALGADALEEEAPLHERFGETRLMTRLRTSDFTELPWLGAWWIGFAPDPGGVDAELQLREGRVELRVRGALAFDASWSPDAVAAEPAFTLRLCPPARGSAT